MKQTVISFTGKEIGTWYFIDRSKREAEQALFAAIEDNKKFISFPMDGGTLVIPSHVFTTCIIKITEQPKQ